jgi:hypothetical protein
LLDGGLAVANLAVKDFVRRDSGSYMSNIKRMSGTALVVDLGLATYGGAELLDKESGK